MQGVHDYLVANSLRTTPFAAQHTGHSLGIAGVGLKLLVHGSVPPGLCCAVLCCLCHMPRLWHSHVPLHLLLLSTFWCMLSCAVMCCHAHPLLCTLCCDGMAILAKPTLPYMVCLFDQRKNSILINTLYSSHHLQVLACPVPLPWCVLQPLPCLLCCASWGLPQG